MRDFDSLNFSHGICSRVMAFQFSSVQFVSLKEEQYGTIYIDRFDSRQSDFLYVFVTELSKVVLLVGAEVGAGVLGALLGALVGAVLGNGVGEVEGLGVGRGGSVGILVGGFLDFLLFLGFLVGFLVGAALCFLELLTKIRESPSTLSVLRSKIAALVEMTKKAAARTEALKCIILKQ